MREGEGGGGEEKVQVITEETLNLWVWGFRVEPITSLLGEHSVPQHKHWREIPKTCVGVSN